MEWSTTQTVDNNALSTIMYSLEALNRNMAKMQIEMSLLKEEVTTLSGRVEQVESQRNSLPSTLQHYHVSSFQNDRNFSTTITPETLHQILNPPRPPLNTASQATPYSSN